MAPRRLCKRKAPPVKRGLSELARFFLEIDNVGDELADLRRRQSEIRHEPVRRLQEGAERDLGRARQCRDLGEGRHLVVEPLLVAAADDVTFRAPLPSKTLAAAQIESVRRQCVGRCQ